MASIGSSISHVHLAKATIKNSVVVETMERVVNTNAFTDKVGVDEIIVT